MIILFEAHREKASIKHGESIKFILSNLILSMIIAFLGLGEHVQSVYI